MKVAKVAVELLNQLSEICAKLENKEFSEKLNILSDATIGQHVRHTLEFFDIMMKGVNDRKFSYDRREHNSLLQENVQLTLNKIDELTNFLDNIVRNEEIELEVEFPVSSINTVVNTNLEREIIYNIEHLIHHMALLKIGIHQNFPHIKLPNYFGVAQTTVAFQENEN